MRNPSGRGASHAVPGFLSPFRLSAFASWVILRPLGKFSRPRGRPTGGRPAGPQRGCRVAHEQDPTGQGALLTPGTVVRSRPTVVSGRHPPLRCGQSLYPAGTSHRRDNLHEASSRVHSRSPITPGLLAAAPGPGASPLPAGLLLARRPRMEREPLRLLPRASHPAVTHDARRGGDRPSRTDPSTTPSTSVEPQRRLPLSLMHPHFAPIRRLLPAPPRGPCQRAQAPTATRPDR